MLRLVLLLSTFFLMSFTSKDEDYFRQNIDQAYKLVETRCNKTYSSEHIDAAFRDYECEFAKKAIDQDIIYKSRQVLIEAIQKFIKSTPTVDTYKVDERTQYSEYKERFTSSPSEVEEFVTKCLGEKPGPQKNNPACRAATEIMLKGLESEQQKFVSQSNTIEQYLDYFKKNPKKVTEIINSKCKQILKNPWYRLDSSSQDKECEAASEILSEKDTFINRTQLIKKLQNIIFKYGVNENILNPDEKAQIASYNNKYANNKKDTEELVGICLEEHLIEKSRNLECITATSILLSLLEAEQNKDAEKRSLLAGDSTIEQYQGYFSAHPEEIDKILDGRCKQIFSDRWYQSDPDMGDKECDAALFIKKKNLALSAKNKLLEQHKQIKDYSYFLSNIKEAEAISDKCKKGTIADVAECENAISVVHEKIIEENKRSEYQLYYEKHPLAAKFFIKWCQSSMLNFNIKCQAALNATKNNEGKQLKTYNEELLIANINKLKNDIESVKKILGGQCKALLEDPWYYLDETIRNEECDAAAEIARIATEQSNNNNTSK